MEIISPFIRCLHAILQVPFMIVQRLLYDKEKNTYEFFTEGQWCPLKIIHISKIFPLIGVKIYITFNKIYIKMLYQLFIMSFCKYQLKMLNYTQYSNLFHVKSHLARGHISSANNASVLLIVLDFNFALEKS